MLVLWAAEINMRISCYRTMLRNTHRCDIYTHKGFPMRTNIEIDDRLMAQAMRRSGARTKKAAVEAGCGFWLKLTPRARFGD